MGVRVPPFAPSIRSAAGKILRSAQDFGCGLDARKAPQLCFFHGNETFRAIPSLSIECEQELVPIAIRGAKSSGIRSKPHKKEALPLRLVPGAQ